MISRRKLKDAVVAGTLALTLMLAYLIWSSRLEAIHTAEATTRGYAAVLEARLDATLRRADAALQQLARSVPVAALQADAVAGYADAINAALDSSMADFAELDGLRLFDTNGELLYTTGRATTGNTAIGDRDHFRKARTSVRNTLVFSEVLVTRTTGKVSMVIVRALRDPQGEFRGVATATLNFDHWLQLFKTLDVGPRGSVAVYRSDNFRQVLRWPAVSEKLNQPLPPGGPAQSALDGGKRTSTAAATSAADGTTRIYSFHALQPYPFFVAVGMAQDDALASWGRRALVLGVFALLLATLLFGLLYRLWRADVELSRLAAVADGSNDAIFVRDARGAIVYWNNGAQRLYGYSFEEVAGKDGAFLIPPDLPQEPAQGKTTPQHGGAADSYETVRLRKDGTRVAVSVGVSAVRDPDGTIVGTATIARDNTARNLAEAAALKAVQRLDVALEGSRISVWESDLRTGDIWLDATWSKMLGYPENETRTTAAQLLKLVPADERQRVTRTAVMAMKDQTPAYMVDHRVKTAGGEWLWIQSRGRVIQRDADGRPLLMSGTNADITERKVAERAQAQLAAIVTSSNDAIVARAPDDTIVSWNAGAERMFGWSAGEALGQSFRRLLSRTGGTRRGRFEKLLGGGPTPPPLDDVRLRKDGTSIQVETTMSAVKDEQGHILFVSCIMRDITERLNAERKIEALATRDELTGLAKRSKLMDEMTIAIARAARTQSRLIAMFVDLDKFKAVNDTLGHHYGDELLRECAQRMTSCVREGDIVARLGGDEFMIVLTDVVDDAIVYTIANRVLELLAMPYTLQGHDIRVSASIGISVYPADGKDAATLIKNADIAMYHAKALNRNNYQFYAEEMNRRILQRAQLERELAAALEHGEFVLHYQPQINVVTGEIQGVESLIRWQHPLRGLLYPGDFIEVAEETGLIVPIGRWVIDHACHTIKTWRAKGVNIPYIGVNVSPAQLNEALIAWVRQALVAHGIEAGWLMIEITETMLMQRVDEAISILQRIRDLGVRIGMDDFGTGYSSLSVLQRLPLDTLKIDRSFVNAIDDETDNTRALTIIGAIIAISKELNLNVVAEGVEKPTQLAFLRTLNCDTYQGYLYSKPLDTVGLEARYAAPGRSVLEDAQGRTVTMTLKVNMELPGGTT